LWQTDSSTTPSDDDAHGKMSLGGAASVEHGSIEKVI